MQDHRQRAILQWLHAHYPCIRDRAQLTQVPQLLTPPDEFCLATDFTPAFIAEACYHGYLPMGEQVAELPVLLIKSHQQRCVLDFANLHLSRKLKRYARGLTLTINQNFAACLTAIAHHHTPTWLIEPLCAAFIQLHQHPRHQVALHSIEIYNDHQLVAGEVGYSTGAIYTSLAGFHNQNGAGSVQLALLGQILARSGFAFWDLGMDLPYKRHLGANIVTRQSFLARWRQERDRPTPAWSIRELAAPAMLQYLQKPTSAAL
jgi:Leu/Phe-tRNA-protein transferase